MMLVCLNLQAGYSIFHNGWRPMYSYIIVSIRTKYENCTIVCIVEVITKSFLRKIKVPNIDLFGQLLIHVIVQLIRCRHQGTKRLNTTEDERVQTRTLVSVQVYSTKNVFILKHLGENLIHQEHF